MKQGSIHILLAVFLFAGGGMVHAQQEALFTQYMFNLFDVNSAVVADGRQNSAVLRIRRQWMGLEGAPSGMLASYRHPGQSGKLSWGFRLEGEEIGARRTYGASGILGKGVRLNDKQSLAFALRLGVLNDSFLSEELLARDSGDELIAQSALNEWALNTGAGIYWRSRRAWLGADLSRILGGKEGSDQDWIGRQVAHVYFTGGGVVELHENWMLRPSALLRMTAGTNPQWELQAALLYSGKLWIGGGYRQSYGIVSYAEYMVSPRWRIGYSYDFPIALPGSFGGSHELFLGMQWAGERGKSDQLRLF